MALIYENGQTKVFPADKRSGNIDLAKPILHLRGKVQVLRNLGDNRYLVSTSLRYINRYRNYHDFDILDLNLNRMLITRENDPVFPELSYNLSKQLISHDKQTMISVFPDELALLSTTLELKVVKPKKGYYFSEVTIHGTSNFKVVELPFSNLGVKECNIRVLDIK